MKVNYVVIARPIPRSLNGETKYYAIVKKKDKVTTRDMMENIAFNTSLRTSDVSSVLESLFTDIPRYLLDGRTIEAGDLGNFYLTLNSEGTETEEEFTMFHIKNVRIRFRPSSVLKKKLGMIDYIRAENGKAK